MARKIIGAAFLSLDGVMQAPGGPAEDPTGNFPYGGWFEPQFDEALGARMGSLFARPFDLLLGRRTYDIFASYWPYMPAQDPTAMLFGQVNKYVLSRSDTALAWQGSHRVGDIDAVAALKDEDGPDLLIQGSSTLYPQLLARGLLDRLELMIGSLVLGSGKRLFDGPGAAADLRLTGHQITPRGVMIATYEPAGPIRTGSFGGDQPSEPERVRRRAMEQGTW